MKSSLKLFAVVFALILGCSVSPTVWAQAASPSTASPSVTPLTPQDKMRLLKVRQQVLDSDPVLKTEQDSLKKQGQALKSGDATPEEKMDFVQDMEAHQQKMKAAMLKIDPTLGPIIDQAAAEMKQKMQARAAQGAGGGN